MWIGYRKAIRKLTFRALAFRRIESHKKNKSDSLRRRANARNVTERIPSDVKFTPGPNGPKSVIKMSQILII